jgi:PPOX class probable F420-dependent enzyme
MPGAAGQVWKGAPPAAVSVEFLPRNSFSVSPPTLDEGGLNMPVKQGDLSLLQNPIAQELLQSKIPARLAYIATDGTPRVVPIWFHWNGREFVMATPPKAPKLKSLARNPKVAITIDDNTFPNKVLMVRGTARLEPVDGIVPEYAKAAERYFGTERGKAWMQQVKTMMTSMMKITITPEWVGVLDFETRFPSALGV